MGHDEPTVLQKLFQLTGKNPLEVSFRDEKVMRIFTTADTLGIPEFGTDFVKRNLLIPLKPTKFSHLLQISGFSNFKKFEKEILKNLLFDVCKNLLIFTYLIND